RIYGGVMQVSRQSLIEELKLLRSSSSPKDLNPVFRSAVFMGDHAWSFNGECGILIKHAGGLRCMVSAESLLSVLVKYDSDQIEIVADNERITVVSGRSKTTLLASDPSVFPN